MTSAFTTLYPEKTLVLTNTVKISYGNRSIEANALWDTGASCSCIASQISRELGMEPLGRRRMYTPSGTADSPVYRVNLSLPNNVVIDNLLVCDSAIGRQGLGIIIGMDVISMGDFATSCRNNRTMFTFRIPSIEDANFLGSII